MKLSLWLPCCALLLLTVAVYGDGESVAISGESKIDGLLVHTITSSYQAGQTEIRVLLPNRVERGKRYPVVYVLPVERNRETRFGDGLLEVQRLDLHNQHAAIFVAPTFSDLPWYADHLTDPKIHQEAYFLNVVVPLMDKVYPTSGRRLLLGFSKSGWGAWSLLLRHPNVFDRAAAWDAPLMMEDMGKYGTSDIFGSQENFCEYRLPDRLRTDAKNLGEGKRLILTGYGNFREHHQKAHDLLESLNIPHEYRDGPSRKHDWDSGWLSEAVELLVGPRSLETGP